MYNNGTVSNSTTTGYTYDEYWRGLLTGYDGEGITYDAIGNPLSYYNGKRYTFSWLYGRRLVSAVVDGKTNTYTYNTEGLRLTKTIDNVVHTYYWDGNTLLMEKWGNSFLRFTYDESGAPLRVHYWNGSESIVYYYVLNLQGDVLEIRDTANNVVCRYSYDAWGKLLSVKDGSGNAITSASHIGNLNPLRYRGYYYDTETGLYYLRSRYYDPQVGRFVNADGYVSTGQGILGYNMFTYCMNNPINLLDLTGEAALATTAGGVALWKIGVAIVGLIGTYFLVDEIAQNPPAVPSISLPEIKTETKSEAKDNSQTLTKRRFKNPVHHIVAKADYRAAEARQILLGVGINPMFDLRNLVILPQSYHTSLHTTAYHRYVTERLRLVAGDRKGVEATLNSLREEILMRSAIGIRWE